MSEVKERIEIPARIGWSAKLSEGEEFRIIDVEGGQAADLFVYNAEKPIEYMSGRHTRVYMDEIYPRAGWTFYSNERRPILEFTEDTSPGKHDCIVAACVPIATSIWAPSPGTPPARRTCRPRPRGTESTSRMHPSR